MNTILHLAAFLLSLWVAEFFFDDLTQPVLGFVCIAIACFLLVLLVLAIFHDATAALGKNGLRRGRR